MVHDSWQDPDAPARLAARERDDVDHEAGEHSRAEAARHLWTDRLRAAVSTGSEVVVHVTAAGPVTGQVLELGDGWLRLRTEAGEAIVGLAAVLAVEGLGDGLPATAAVADRLGWGVVLRTLARERRPVAVLLVDGSRWSGQVGRVGADALDVVRTPDPAASPGRHRSTVTVPIRAIALVRVA